MFCQNLGALESVRCLDACSHRLLLDGLGLVAKRLQRVASADPPTVRIISDNPIYAPYERSAEEINVLSPIRWVAREI